MRTSWKNYSSRTLTTPCCASPTAAQVYWLKVHQLPQAGRNARGRPMVNLLPLEEGEKINAVLPVKQYDEQHFVFMATSQGTVKKTPLDAFSRPRSAGIIAIDLHDNDRLVGVALTDGQREVILVTSGGKAIRFPEEEVRPDGPRGCRRARRQTRRRPGADRAHRGAARDTYLTASEHGYGKRTPLEDFPVHGRGGQGVIALQTTDSNGATVGAVQVTRGRNSCSSVPPARWCARPSMKYRSSGATPKACG